MDYVRILTHIRASIILRLALIIGTFAFAPGWLPIVSSRKAKRSSRHQALATIILWCSENSIEVLVYRISARRAAGFDERDSCYAGSDAYNRPD